MNGLIEGSFTKTTTFTTYMLILLSREYSCIELARMLPIFEVSTKNV